MEKVIVKYTPCGYCGKSIHIDNLTKAYKLGLVHKDCHVKFGGHCQAEEESEPRCKERCHHCIQYYAPIDK